MPALALAAAGLLALAACGVPYYTQAVVGQARILLARQPLEEAAASAAELEVQLETVRRARDFASRELGLPDNRSYRYYVDLGRPFATWNVVAAPELGVDPRTWCFPVAGCVSYRGYFQQERANRYGAKLAAKGDDISVYGVRAYSTLGWFADPVLSSFVDLPAGDLAGLIFHELAHQVVYVQDDTAFNESFATTVEQRGLELWTREGSLAPDALDDLRRRRAHDAEFTELALEVREELRQTYESDLSEAQMRAAKRELFADLKTRFAELRSRWGADDRYDAWMDGELNNAHLASIGSYHEHVAAFEQLFERHGEDWSAFYEAVEELGELPLEVRNERLAELAVRSEATPGATD